MSLGPRSTFSVWQAITLASLLVGYARSAEAQALDASVPEQVPVASEVQIASSPDAAVSDETDAAPLPAPLDAPDAASTPDSAVGPAPLPASDEPLTLVEGDAALPSEAPTALIAPEPEPDKELGAVVVTGVRGGQARSVIDSPSPIDVIDHREVQDTGRTGLKEILGAVVPAMSMPAQGGGGTSASVRPYTYRGLSGDYLLVLVNGKRRHSTALINNLSRLSGGSTPVDLDLIPAAAIGRIEILRDGAAAQYGSDAISGVLNIILDKTPEGLTYKQTAGRHYEMGGEMLQQQLSLATPLGNQGGFLRVSAEARYRDRAKSSGSPLPDVRANGATNYFYPPIAADQPEPREAATEDKVIAGGYGRSNRDLLLNLAYNAELPITKSLSLYSFSTLSYRDIKDARGAYPANNINSLPEIYPNGFQAYRRIWEWDGQATLGAREQFRGWDFDLSTSYGRDAVKLGAVNTLNPSLGPTSPTTFFMGRQYQDLWISDLDFSKPWKVGLAEPLTTAFGLQHRWERFENREGEPDSYRDGGYIVPIGSDPFHQTPLPNQLGGFGGLSPSPGLASFTGTSPADARKPHRQNVAAYVDLNTNIVKPWFVGAAGRYEHYTDSAGDVVSGKLSSRYELPLGFAVRAGLNSGFRAPSLSQSSFSTTQNTASVIGGNRVSTTSKFLAVDSDAAEALGAKPLKPEKSVSFTGGITYEFPRFFRFTIDGYQTQIDDRIVKTDFIGTTNNGGAAVRELLQAQGVTGVDSAQFFTNAIDTTTRGFDVVGELTLRTDNFGTIRPTAALSYARTSIDHVEGNPQQLQNLNVTRFGRQGKIDLTSGAPRLKTVLSGSWSLGRFRSDLRVTRYGKYTEASTTAGFDRKFSAKWITDVDVGYDLTEHVNLAIGAYNLFDVYPKRNGIVSQEGTGQYGLFAPFGLSGGFYYARLSVNY